MTIAVVVTVKKRERPHDKRCASTASREILPLTAKFAKAAMASMRTDSCGTLAKRTSLGMPPSGNKKTKNKIFSIGNSISPCLKHKSK